MAKTSGITKARQVKEQEDSALIQANGYRINDGTEGVSALKEASPFRSEFDRPYAARATEQLGMPQFELGEWDFGTRCDQLKRCHQAWERNPLAHTAVAYTRRYAVGTGMKVSYRAAEVKEVLEEFLGAEDNRVDSLEKEVCDALQVDGEIFWRLHTANGKTRLSVIEPWKVKEIECDPNSPNRRVSYVLTDGSKVAADDVRHDAINKMPYEKRGRPELFRVLPWLKAYRDWLENRARRNRYMAMLYDVTLKGATVAQVNSKRSQYAEPPSPASTVIHNENETWQVLSGNIQAGDAEPDGRRLLLMIAAGVELPEFMLSDANQTTMASATVQQFPPMLKFEDYQDVLQTSWAWILRLVIDNAVAAGLIPAQRNDDGSVEAWLPEIDVEGDPVLDKDGQPRLVLAQEAFSVNYRKIAAQDPKSLAEALQIQAMNGWVDGDTAMQELGRDPSVIRKRLAQQQAESDQMTRTQQLPEVMAQIDAAEAAGVIDTAEANQMRADLESGATTPDAILMSLQARMQAAGQANPPEQIGPPEQAGQVQQQGQPGKQVAKNVPGQTPTAKQGEG
jgi:hypothetical protein